MDQTAILTKLTEDDGATPELLAEDEIAGNVYVTQVV